MRKEIEDAINKLQDHSSVIVNTSMINQTYNDLVLLALCNIVIELLKRELKRLA